MINCSSSTTVSNMSLGGGQVHVCGNLTVNNITFNSGTIIIATFATLTINNNVTLNNNCTIANYGRLVINGNLQFQNSNNYLYTNANNAATFISGSVTFNSNPGQNQFFINRGYCSIGTFIPNNGGTVCLEDGSYLAASTFNYSNINNATNNVVSYGSGNTGTATVFYSTTANLGNNSKSVTTSSNVNICKGSGSTQTGNGTWGAATITNGCTLQAAAPQTGTYSSCGMTQTVLPVELISFKATLQNNTVNLNWATASERNNSFFSIERSSDMNRFEVLSTQPAKGNSRGITNYSATDNAPLQGISYYRLKQTDHDGDYSYSSPVYVSNTHIKNQFRITPNPAGDKTVLSSSDQVTAEIRMYSANGYLIRTFSYNASPESPEILDIAGLPTGLYLLHVITANDSQLLKLVKE